MGIRASLHIPLKFSLEDQKEGPRSCNTPPSTWSTWLLPACSSFGVACSQIYPLGNPYLQETDISGRVSHQSHCSFLKYTHTHNYTKLVTLVWSYWLTFSKLNSCLTAFCSSFTVWVYKQNKNQNKTFQINMLSNTSLNADQKSSEMQSQLHGRIHRFPAVFFSSFITWIY